ncbi:nitric oxide-associated protein 1 isoform X2 [Frieseomelitta varia]|uniref:nitric oxide-associated protein 1 isoform X2 n=1 Tax=Frieseomelitta varia TaxID=561572 RepID=UPI001CB6B24D|nr:nitric oxide-associated protein 1 isoform X2 [Frieseomelitta varia]
MRFQLFGLSGYGVRRNSGLREFRRWHAILYKNVEPTLRRKLDASVLAVRDKLLYCDYLDAENVQVGYKKRKTLEKLLRMEEERERYEEIAHKPVFSVLLSNNSTASKEKVDSHSEEWTTTKEKPVHMPYAMVDSYEMINSVTSNDAEEPSENALDEEHESLHDRYSKIKASGLTELNFEDFVKTMEKSVDSLSTPHGELWKVPDNWMTDYEQFDDSLMNWYARYGTPDPNSKVSSVPCGGCGALLHCRDPAIPGYLPSELFSSKNTDELKLMTCQRCHFLKFYNAALEVKVSIEDYPRLLKVIKSKKCAIILIVDVTDFPCCIWPDLKTIMHPFTPIFLVGNKVDLLPRDCPSFLENVKQRLKDAVIDITGVKKENITHVQLASAKTGYGIEQLINKLQNKWQHKGDVYLVGCTNVGKSSLFNTLINSDYCKVQAIDLVQRATVSAWPGTTLNLLKFPILNPTGKKRRLRTIRLIGETSYKMTELEYNNLKFKETRNIKYATLKEHIGKTFTMHSSSNPMRDPFSEISHKSMSGNSVLDETRPEYKQSRWCYDTPGTIQTDQILNLLTTDELLLTLPQEIISPRTFMFKPKQTVFVAGMGRLDYLEGEHFIRYT